MSRRSAECCRPLRRQHRPGRSRDGVLPGRILLDEQFSRSAFEAALAGPNNVVHVASHFDFHPGSESN